MQTLQIEKPDVATGYEKVKNLIHKLAIGYAKSHGGDVDELVSEGHVAFMRAYPKWDPEIGALTTLMYHAVINQFNSYSRRQAKHQGYQFGQAEETKAEDVVDDKPTFDLPDFLETLSNDARVVVQLIFNAPRQLEQDAEDKGGHAKNWRSSLRQLLRDMQWSVEEIRSAFDEVRNAL